ncbi:MAG: hypothetical protein WC299_06035 [Kiritimatiellia bacterium]
MKSTMMIIALLFWFLPSPPVGSAAVISRAVAGGFHSVALCADGTVWACGPTICGILGDAKPEIDFFAWPYRYSTIPVPITGKKTGALAGIRQIAAGQHFTLALAADGTIWAWGDNSFGQLGDASTPGPEHFYLTARERSTPGQVVGPGAKGLLTDVQTVAAGYQHALALRKDGTVWAWGDNSAGQLGNGTTTAVSAPVQVLGPGAKGFLTDIIAIAAGTRHNLALRKDGTVWAWGSNSAGQLGDGTMRNSLAPVQVNDVDGNGFLTDVRSISAGTASSLALIGDGTVRAWGNNSFGQIGDGTRKDSSLPVQVKGIGGKGTLADITALAAGRYYAAALDRAGTVLAWGFNEGGILDNGTLEGSLTPAPVRGAEGAEKLTGIKEIAAGSRHMLALQTDGSLWAWGDNGAGQLGDAGITSGLVPVRVRMYPEAPEVAHGTGQWALFKAPGTLPLLPGVCFPVADKNFKQAIRFQVAPPIIPEDLDGPAKSVASQRAQQAYQLDFTPVSNGCLAISLDVRVSTADSRTLDVTLFRAAGAGWQDEAWSLLWGHVPGKLSDLAGDFAAIAKEWHNYRIVSNLDNNTYSLWVDGKQAVADRPFRQRFPAGTPLGRLLVGATHVNIKGAKIAPGAYADIGNIRIGTESSRN